MQIKFDIDETAASIYLYPYVQQQHKTFQFVEESVANLQITISTAVVYNVPE